MIVVLALIGWLGKYLYLVDGEIDGFRLNFLNKKLNEFLFTWGVI